MNIWICIFFFSIFVRALFHTIPDFQHEHMCACRCSCGSACLHLLHQGFWFLSFVYRTRNPRLFEKIKKPECTVLPYVLITCCIKWEVIKWGNSISVLVVLSAEGSRAGLCFVSPPSAPSATLMTLLYSCFPSIYLVVSSWILFNKMDNESLYLLKARGKLNNGVK